MISFHFLYSFLCVSLSLRPYFPLFFLFLLSFSFFLNPKLPRHGTHIRPLPHASFTPPVFCVVCFFFLLKKYSLCSQQSSSFSFFFFLLSFSFFTWAPSTLCSTIGLLWHEALSEVEVERQRLLDFRPHCQSDSEHLVSRYEHTFNETRRSWLFNCHTGKPEWLLFLTFFLFSFRNFWGTPRLVRFF